MAWLKFSRNTSRTDEELLARYLEQGDEQSLNLLCERYLELVYGLCLRYFKQEARAEDAAMDVFEQLPAKLKGRKIDSFRPWLYRVVSNQCLMVLRRKASQMSKDSNSVSTSTFDESLAMYFPDNVHLSEEGTTMEKQFAALDFCKQRLSAIQKLCIEQFYLEGASYAEISDVQALAIGKVRSAIQNGKRMLKSCMEKKLAHG